MKWLVGIVSGVILIGAVSVIAALAWLMPFSVTTEAGEVIDLIPYDLNARLSNDGSVVELTWSEIEAEDASIVVQRSRSGSEGNWVELAELAPGSTSYQDRDLESGARYVYRLRTFDPSGGAGMTSVASIDRRVP